MFAAPVAAGARAEHRAAIVVEDTGGTKVNCVPFTGSSITGLQLLQRGGFTLGVNVSSIGTAVCSLNGTGCASTSNCFCLYPLFWGYWTRAPNATSWTFAQAGAQARKVTDGSTDAWVWGRGSSGPKPPNVSFKHACASASGVPSGSKKPSSNYAAFGAFVGAMVIVGGGLAFRRSKRSR